MKTVLVVEDQNLMRHMVNMAVEDEYSGATVHGVGTLDMALKSIAELPYELIILDPGLPGVDPNSSQARLSVVNVVRSASPSSKLIVLTGSMDENEAIAMRAVGADGYWAKTGLGPEDLRQQLRRINAGRYMVRLADVGAERREISLARLPARERQLAEFLLACPPDTKRKFLFEAAAKALNIDVETVRTYIKRIRRKIPELEFDYEEH